MHFLPIVCWVCFVSQVLFSVATDAGRRNRNRNNARRIAIPNVEALSPQGLRVWIADRPGINLYAFHGKINAPMQDLEAGDMSKDILKSKNGKWIFEDRNVELRVGDVVNFWIHVQIDGIGHNVLDQSAVIKELIRDEADSADPSLSGCRLPDSGYNYQNSISTTTHVPPPAASPSPAPAESSCDCNREQLDSISTQLQVTLSQLSALNDKLDPLRKQVDSLKEFIEDVSKDTDIGTKLLLVGAQPPKGNPLEAVRNLITDKLELVDLEESILSAQKTPRGILFEVSSTIAKKRILLRASKRLMNSNIKIADPDDPESVINGKYLMDERIAK